MAFWDLDGGGKATDNVADGYQQEGGNLEPIPAGSRVLMEVFEGKWAAQEDGSNRHVSLHWMVIAPEEFKNRRVFQKLWVTDFDPRVLNTKGEDKAKKKRNTARTMLAAIDNFAGKPLSKNDREPTDDDLARLKGQPMIGLLMVYSMVDSRNTSNPNIEGNWVCGIYGAASGMSTGPARKPGQSADDANRSAVAGAKAAGYGGNMVLDDDEIPF